MDMGEVAQELINYGRKYGPVNNSSKIDPKGLKRREVKSPPRLTNGKPQTHPTCLGGRNIPNKRQGLWTLGWQKGVPKDLMDGVPTDKLEKLVLEWSEKNPMGLKEKCGRSSALTTN